MKDMAGPAALGYCYGQEAEQYCFYRISKALFTDELLRRISAEAMVPYGLLLDRTCLSVKSGWMDTEDRGFIYFTCIALMELDLQSSGERCATDFLNHYGCTSQFEPEMPDNVGKFLRNT